jgi:hypothetical protein
MAINSTPKAINVFCRKYINPKIEKRIADAELEGQLTPPYPEDALDLLMHFETDSTIVTWLKLALYYFEFNGLGNITEPGVEIAKIYGIPVDSLQESVRFIPQVKVFFREKTIEAWNDGRRPRIAEMTIRLDSDYVAALKESKDALPLLASIVSDTFKAITYKKGYQKYHYRDLDNNYRLSVFVDTAAEAKMLFTALLNINGHTPDFANHLIYPKTTKDYTVVETKKILGADLEMYPERTEANMVFYKAELHWKGIYPILLVNNSYKHRNAIIELKY